MLRLSHPNPKSSKYIGWDNGIHEEWTSKHLAVLNWITCATNTHIIHTLHKYIQTYINIYIYPHSMAIHTQAYTCTLIHTFTHIYQASTHISRGLIWAMQFSSPPPHTHTYIYPIFILQWMWQTRDLAKTLKVSGNFPNPCFNQVFCQIPKIFRDLP